MSFLIYPAVAPYRVSMLMQAFTSGDGEISVFIFKKFWICVDWGLVAFIADKAIYFISLTESAGVPIVWFI